MNKFKNLMFASLSLISAHNAFASSSFNLDDPVVIQKDNGSDSVNHSARRSRAQRPCLPDVLYDSSARILKVYSSEPIEFIYILYSEEGFVVSQGTICVKEDQDATIQIPAGVEGECTITLEINGQTYSGSFYVQGNEW